MKDNIRNLTGIEKKAILLALLDCSNFNPKTKNVLFLMNEMNRMYGKTIYEESHLSCRDCTTRILTFWKTISTGWSALKNI